MVVRVQWTFCLAPFPFQSASPGPQVQLEQRVPSENMLVGNRNFVLYWLLYYTRLVVFIIIILIHRVLKVTLATLDHPESKEDRWVHQTLMDIVICVNMHRLRTVSGCTLSVLPFEYIWHNNIICEVLILTWHTAQMQYSLLNVCDSCVRLCMGYIMMWRSLHDLQHWGPDTQGCVNCIGTNNKWYNQFVPWATWPWQRVCNVETTALL